MIKALSDEAIEVSVLSGQRGATTTYAAGLLFNRPGQRLDSADLSSGVLGDRGYWKALVRTADRGLHMIDGDLRTVISRIARRLDEPLSRLLPKESFTVGRPSSSIDSGSAITEIVMYESALRTEPPHPALVGVLNEYHLPLMHGREGHNTTTCGLPVALAVPNDSKQRELALFSTVPGSLVDLRAAHSGGHEVYALIEDPDATSGSADSDVFAFLPTKMRSSSRDFVVISAARTEHEGMRVGTTISEAQCANGLVVGAPISAGSTARITHVLESHGVTSNSRAVSAFGAQLELRSRTLDRIRAAIDSGGERAQIPV